jgi:transcriptional regulator with XRE-family HTH domain
MLKATQVRMARAALGWGVRDLAKKAGIAANTVSRYENGSGATVATVEAMRKVLEDAGVIFVPADETGGPGVRLKTSGMD